MLSTRWTRAFLVATGILALGAGTLLALGADRTERRFAWTIPSDLTTAFLNGAYWAGAVLLVLSARERFWPAARIGAFAAALFMTLLLIVMLVHFELLHTDDPRFLVSAGAWGFLLSYAVLPVLGVLALAHQLRSSGGEASRNDLQRPEAIPVWLRGLFAVQAVPALVVGAALLLVATRAQVLWPWPLTSIGARSIGVWVLLVGAVSTMAWFEADWRRIRTVPPTYAVLAVLQLTALARFRGDVDWDRPAPWFYLVALAALLAVVFAGLARLLGTREVVPA